MLNLDLVDDNVGKVPIAAERYPHPLLSRTNQCKGRGFFQERGRIFQGVLGLTFGDKLPQALDDVAGAQGLFGAPIERFAEFYSCRPARS